MEIATTLREEPTRVRGRRIIVSRHGRRGTFHILRSCRSTNIESHCFVSLLCCVYI